MVRNLNEDWKYRLDKRVAKTLRDAIESEDYGAVREALKAAWKAVYEIVNDEDIFDEDDLSEKIDDLDFLDIEPDASIDASEEDIEDNFNYELDDFYDFCDGVRIWIPLR